MPEVVVVAVAKAKPGSEREVADAMCAVAAQSHAEQGCLRYAIHRGLDDATRIVVVERWRSRADLDEHFTKPYVQALAERTPLLDEPPQVHMLEALPSGDSDKGAL